jgi:primosomal protein N' (replication factor Y)
MQSAKPLRLKREIYRSQPRADTLDIVNVWVDSGVSHLDGLYTYRVPNDLVGKIVLGSRVKVPFNGQSCEALVVEKSTAIENLSSFKIIESLLGPIPVANSQTITFYRQMADFWASDPYSLIKLGIPLRVPTVEKKFEEPFNLNEKVLRKRTRKAFLMHNPYISAYVELFNLVNTRMKLGSTLLLLPDIKDVTRVCKLLDELNPDFEILRLDSSLNRAQRYENYLRATISKRVLVIGTRSAIFAPIQDLQSIIVGFEKSEQYFEQKHPYWNARDSSLLRSEIESADIFFTGYVPSAEIAFQIEKRNISFLSQTHSLKTLAFPQNQGELLPNRIFPEIRKALKVGKVLFLAPRKGYANALLCSKCRNMALCECGGRLMLLNQVSDPMCSICGQRVKNWKCKWCSGTTRYAAGRGIERFSEEIGKAFPNLPIQISSAPNILESVSPKTKIVISSIGSIPGNVNDYACVIILEGQRFLSNASTTFEETVYESFFESASRLKKDGKILLVLDDSHPTLAALSRWNPSNLIRKILRENSEASLPPYVSTAVVKVSLSEGTVIRNGFFKSIKDGRLPLDSQVYLTEDTSKNEARILISVPRNNRADLAFFLRELSRKRAISKKDYISICLDPYALLP